MICVNQKPHNIQPSVKSLADAFRYAIESNPEDDTCKLVFADWCEESGAFESARRLRWWAKARPLIVDAQLPSVSKIKNNKPIGSLAKQLIVQGDDGHWKVVLVFTTLYKKLIASITANSLTDVEWYSTCLNGVEWVCAGCGEKVDYREIPYIDEPLQSSMLSLIRWVTPDKNKASDVLETVKHHLVDLAFVHAYWSSVKSFATSTGRTRVRKRYNGLLCGLFAELAEVS